MGRAKVEIRYREDIRARRSTYLKRMKGLKKKASELSVLCGVDVIVASLSPELNTLEFWPEKDTPEFNRIRERYCSRKKKNNSEHHSLRMPSPLSSANYCGKSEQHRLPMPSLFSLENYTGNREQHSLPMPASFRPEEMTALQIKLKEVRDRLSFLRGYSQNENILHQRHQEEEEKEGLQGQEQDFHLHEPSSPFFQSLSPLPLDFNTPLQQDQSALLLCDSPLRSHIDDLTWCNSLILDHE